MNRRHITNGRIKVIFGSCLFFFLYHIHDNGKHLDTIPSTIYNIQGISFRLRYYSCPATSA